MTDFKNGDTVKIKYGMFSNFLGEYYEDDDNNIEVYIPATRVHTGFYVYVNEKSFLEKY